MKRLIAFTVLVGLLTAAAATLGSAAPSGPSGPIGSGQAAGQAEAPCSTSGRQVPRQLGDRCQMRHPAVRLAGHERPKPRLRRRGRTPVREVGVRVASKVSFTCVTTASRIGTLTSGRVDIIISTLTWTAERERTIDYSAPYYGAAGKLLVKNDVTAGRLSDWMKGKKIVSTSGSIYDRWIKNCFKETTFQVVSSPSAGVLAVRNGQADALMYDDAFLVGVAANASDLKMTNHKFLNVPWGVGIRKGDVL